MIWNRLRGHSVQIEMFRRAVQRNRTAHAYSLIGPGGIGKRLFAHLFAQCLFCQEVANDDLDACGECPACRQAAAGTHPDLLTIGCPEGKRELPIELVAGPPERRGREGLCHDLSLRPMSADRRIAIIDDAHTLNEESANALLKTLEEPPPGAVLFLISTSADALLPTIRSRCQPVHFSSLPEADVAALVVELGWESDVNQARDAAALSSGSLTTAQDLLDPGLRKLREALQSQLVAVAQDPVAAADALVELVESQASDTPGQRQAAGWMLAVAVRQFRDLLEQIGGSESQSDADVAQVVRRSGGDAIVAADRLAASIDRCVQADFHLQQMMPVPLCLAGLCDDLSRIQRGLLPLSG